MRRNGGAGVLQPGGNLGFTELDGDIEVFDTNNARFGNIDLRRLRSVHSRTAPMVKLRHGTAEHGGAEQEAAAAPSPRAGAEGLKRHRLPAGIAQLTPSR